VTVFVNLASSVDGKIGTVAREKFRFGSAADKRQMQVLRARADAVVIGAGTLRDEDPSLLLSDPDLVDARRAAGKSAQPLRVLVSHGLELRVEGSRFFGTPGMEPLVFTSGTADRGRAAQVARFASVLTLPDRSPGRIDLAPMIEILQARGCAEILVEGGGELVFALLEQSLIDELYLTLCPVLLGGPAPGAVGGAGFLAAVSPRLDLLSHHASPAGELFLHYKVVRPGREDPSPVRGSRER